MLFSAGRYLATSSTPGYLPQCILLMEVSW
jgi:hypothetical protein